MLTRARYWNSKEVGEEIIKVALKLILERGSNPRLQSNMAVNQSISDINRLKGRKIIGHPAPSFL
jgi:hypothetical protein